MHPHPRSGSALRAPSPETRERVSKLTQCDVEALLGAGARHHRLIPALDVGVVAQIDLMALVPPGPAKDRKIGDRHPIAGRIRRLAETCVEDAVEPVGFL